MQWLIDIVYEAVMAHFKGVIVQWSGAIVDIPTGWHLCDGTEGTPDLRDKFIVGASGGYAVGAAGGQASQTHDFTGDGHNHLIKSHQHVAAGTDFHVVEYTGSDTIGSNNATGTTDAADNRPPYYALCFIMKL